MALRALLNMIQPDRDPLDTAISDAEERAKKARRALDAARAEAVIVDENFAKAKLASLAEPTDENVNAVMKSSVLKDRAAALLQKAEDDLEKAEDDVDAAVRKKLEAELADAKSVSDPSAVNRMVAELVKKHGDELVDLVFKMNAAVDKVAADSRNAMIERRRISAELGLDADQVERSISCDMGALSPHRVLAGMLAERFNARPRGREVRLWLAGI